jgi:hypothetical protein
MDTSMHRWLQGSLWELTIETGLVQSALRFDLGKEAAAFPRRREAKAAAISPA